MPIDHARRHSQLHKVLENEEVVEVVNDKGEPAKYKLDHKDKQVFIEGGPEEDCEWKHTNGSYDDIVRRAFLNVPAAPLEASGIESDEDIEPVGVPGFEVPPTEPASDSL
jgi:hypothetical protein